MTEQQPETRPAQGKAWRRLLYLSPLAVFAVLAGAFLWGLDPARDPRHVPTTMLEQPIPDFDYPAVEGLDRPGLAAADLRAGTVTVINFFASWCLPCRAEHPNLVALVERRGVQLHGINHRDKPADARRFLSELGNPYARIGADPGRGAVNWGVYGLPETFIVDGQGKIRFHHRGPLIGEAYEAQFLPVLEALR